MICREIVGRFRRRFHHLDPVALQDTIDALEDEVETLERSLARATKPGPLDPHPDWSRFRDAAELLQALLDAGPPAMTAVGDANQAYVRDIFDTLGLSIRDPSTLYVALVSQNLLVEMTANAARNGVGTIRTVGEVANAARAFAAAVLDYLPAEARR